ncbi:3-hydroxyacyl-ACP dehydratase FabZ [Lacrimispora saccharolytica]|uniref:3-hydroxyacyl-ACP dehydratase FabZ n=1 Tax=Lacrimispora saccharolytica TaxID=84030 RepID=UPI001B7C7C98|nr:3-hydroxyacyl-ACP dehydratase FabZ [Lacrimispora saccharolytica]MBP9001797.1 3-hydroxyacyl-ACP dehydratase FabZ [Lachnospiraceae bacterium]MBS7329822.1 3-hydroxyacyl-ACP dehydratase FabZ [Lachnospiraceae bacterium]MCF2655958.1 3-hydroxyacyl-ACP dehydratase FabZ [Lacrimispora saccharolytica]MCI7557374.1 3-hydroxyacyl-ACP dehydratase FabZ [Lachnospiraceae bacterium]MDD7548097.1 3-hydroxyacyl-ACP dehydratase FabZ [Lachnospiraceae bacterium]
MSVYTTKEIMEILPHRAPFLLIDTVEELEPGKRVVAKKCVTYNEPFFQGHFPGNPVMPGVLICEALAQAGAVAILGLDENKGKTAYFASMDKVKFKKKVLPGDVLMLEVELVKIKGPFGIAKAKATVDSKVAVSGEFTFALGE